MTCAPKPRCRAASSASSSGTPPTGTDTIRAGITHVAHGPPRSADVATPPRCDSGRARPSLKPRLGSAPPHRCLAAAAADSRSLGCPGRSATVPKEWADRRMSPRDCHCRHAPTRVGPSAQSSGAVRPAPSQKAPGQSSLGGKTRVCSTAPEHSSTTRSHEIMWLLASRFWSAASISQVSCGFWARCQAVRAAALAGLVPSRARAATFGSSALRGARTPGSTGSIRLGCDQPPSGHVDGGARGRPPAVREPPPGVVRKRDNGVAKRSGCGQDQPEEHVASSPGPC